MSDIRLNSDVIVIGGGIIGLTVAYRLAREGLKVTALERNVCGREASWAGAGVLQCGSWHRTDPLAGLLRESLRLYPEFAAELFERTRIDPELVPSGSFELLLEDQQYRMAASEVAAAERYRDLYGKPVLEMLTPQQALEAEPRLRPDLLGVKYCPVTSQLRPPLLVAAVRAACLLENVQIVEHAPAFALIRDGERVAGVRTSRGDFTAGNVVLSAGAWSSLIDGAAASSVKVYPVRGQIVLLQRLQRPFTHVIERGKCYMVPRLDGRVLVGATEEHEAGYDTRNTAGGVGGLLALSQTMVPSLAEATLVRTWAGLRPGTPDRGPYLGPVPGLEGLLAATGHFRSGLILAPITSQIIADLILRGRTEYDLSRYAAGRELKLAKKKQVVRRGDLPTEEGGYD